MSIIGGQHVIEDLGTNPLVSELGAADRTTGLDDAVATKARRHWGEYGGVRLFHAQPVSS